MITILKAKLHRVTVRSINLEYEGSCAIDENLLKEANIKEYEQIHIYNINNGKRIITYAIKAKPHSGIISLNGSAARSGLPGDKLIICAYGMVNPSDVDDFYRPNIVKVNVFNVIINDSGEMIQ